MLGWNITITHQDETILNALSQDWELDRKIRESATTTLSHNDGYPNRYQIRNDQLPSARLYRHTLVASDVPRVDREELELRPFPDISNDTLLFVELWDQS